MIGMDEITGKLISGEAWIRQAVRRAIKTQKGSRPMLRWYGVNHLKYLARQITAGSVLDLTADLSDSIEATIPGARLQTIIGQENGERIKVSLELETNNIEVEA
jgi:phage baseplate assembly protein W